MASFTYESTYNQALTADETGLPRIVNTYDSAGRLKTRADGLGTTSYRYDTRGQLTTTTAPGNAVTHLAMTPWATSRRYTGRKDDEQRPTRRTRAT